MDIRREHLPENPSPPSHNELFFAGFRGSLTSPRYDAVTLRQNKYFSRYAVVPSQSGDIHHTRSRAYF